jgi:glycosyltransferase involved in cell wall biosynthesis
MTKISIVVPTFNSERFIETCINSILIQNYQNYEVIICDNCSTDNTIKIINQIVKKNNKFKIFIKKDKGVADALNFGFNLSTGNILCWINSDDLYVDSFVLKLVTQKFKENAKKNYLIGNFININTEGNNIKKFYSFKPFFKMNNIFYYNQIFTGSFFFTKKLFNNFGSFDEKKKFAFEYEILIYALKNYQGIYVNNFLSKFRIVPNALSSNKVLLNREFRMILKKNDLTFSNSIFFRVFAYINQGVFLYVLKNKIYQLFLSKKF